MTFPPKTRTTTVAICALVRFLSGIILLFVPFKSPFATAFLSAVVDQLSGISENDVLLFAVEFASAAYAATDIILTSIVKTNSRETVILLCFIYHRSFVLGSLNYCH